MKNKVNLRESASMIRGKVSDKLDEEFVAYENRRFSYKTTLRHRIATFFVLLFVVFIGINVIKISHERNPRLSEIDVLFLTNENTGEVISITREELFSRSVDASDGMVSVAIEIGGESSFFALGVQNK